MELPGAETRRGVLGTGVLLLLLAGLLYAMRETLSPGVVGLCVAVAFVCDRRGVPGAVTLSLIAGVLLVAWGMDGIAAVGRPIAIGAVMAYLFAPLVGRLETLLKSRSMAILAVMLAILLAVAGVGVAVVPRLLSEVGGLIRSFPEYSARLTVWYGRTLAWAAQFGVGDRVEGLRQRVLEDLPGIGQAAMEYAIGRLSGLLTRAAALLDMLIVPFVAFYLLKDGERIGEGLTRVLPLRLRTRILGTVRRIDEVLGEYVRGQVIVCGAVAALTSLGLAISGIPYALLLGCMAGILNVVPYVGLLTTLGASCVVACFDPSPGAALVKVLAVFAVVQGLEGNLITPKIVGERVGLHPLWVILAVAAFSRMWGVVGMVAAVPVAAVLNVLIRTAAEAYYQSEFYREGS